MPESQSESLYGHTDRYQNRVGDLGTGYPLTCV